MQNFDILWRGKWESENCNAIWSEMVEMRLFPSSSRLAIPSAVHSTPSLGVLYTFHGCTLPFVDVLYLPWVSIASMGVLYLLWVYSTFCGCTIPSVDVLCLPWVSIASLGVLYLLWVQYSTPMDVLCLPWVYYSFRGCTLPSVQLYYTFCGCTIPSVDFQRIIC